MLLTWSQAFLVHFRPLAPPPTFPHHRYGTSTWDIALTKPLLRVLIRVGVEYRSIGLPWRLAGEPPLPLFSFPPLHPHLLPSLPISPLTVDNEQFTG
jgi:hypothetical protein